MFPVAQRVATRPIRPIVKRSWNAGWGSGVVFDSSHGVSCRIVVGRHGATLVNWEAVGAIAESIGAAAVLLTLVYLARQIKHNSEVTKVASYHQAIDQIVQAGVDPDFSLLRAKFELGEPLTKTAML